MLTKSKAQTQKIAAKLAKMLVNEHLSVPHSGIRAKKIISEGAGKPACAGRHAKVLALIGDLGSGKTAFVQGFIKALGIKTHIPSPTFVIYRKYRIVTCDMRQATCFKNIYHFDLYRIQKPKEIIDLGFKKILKNPENIVLIEWPEQILKFLPKNTIWVKLFHGRRANERIVNVRCK